MDGDFIGEAALAWVAGLLEGEGCFTRHGGAGTARNIRVQCYMTDLDVLRRLARLVGGAVRGPYTNGPRSKLYKPRYVWEVTGARARELMERLLPRMGERRSTQIRALIDGYDAVQGRRFLMLHLESGRVEETQDMKAWLRAHGMNEGGSGLYRTLTGERSQCFGWRRLA